MVPLGVYAAAALGLCRLEPLDLLHGSGFDLSNDNSFDELCALASSGLVGAACAAPLIFLSCPPASRWPTPCPYSGIPSLLVFRLLQLASRSVLHTAFSHPHVSCMRCLSWGFILLENPSSSLVWKDPAVQSWLRVHAPFSSQAAACHYGLSLFKSWTFWSNFPAVESLACMCQHPRGFHPSFAGKRLPHGSFATRHTACYPSQLAQAIVHCVQPWLTLRPAAIPLASGKFPASVILSKTCARPGSAASCSRASFRLSCLA